MPSSTSSGGEWTASSGESVGVGNVVLCNEAYAWVVRAHLLAEFCSGCMKRPSSVPLLQCQACRVVRYCNKNCSAHDWRLGGHKRECKHLASMVAQLHNEGLDEARLLIRTFAGSTRPTECGASTTNINTPLCCGSAHFRCMSQAAGVSELGPQFESTPDQIWCCAVLSKARQVLQTGGVEVTLEELAGRLARFRTNNFGVLDELFSLVGHGVYPGAALLQHSCAPSCLLVYKGTTLHAIALGSLKAGDELTHAYVDLCQPVRVRQRLLQESHNFTCACPRCCEQLLVHSLDTPWLPTALEKDFMAAVNDVADDPLAVRLLLERLPEHTSRAHALVELLLCEAAAGPFSCEGYAAACRAFEAALDAQRIEESAELCRRLVSFLALALCHLPFHPLLGLQLFTLGDLCAVLGLKKDAAAFYNWCYEIVSKTHDAEISGGDLLERLEASRATLF